MPCQKSRKKRDGRNDCRGQIKDHVSIDERSPIVEERTRIGDWEADTVISRPGGTVLVTMAERTSRVSREPHRADPEQAGADRQICGLNCASDSVQPGVYADL